MRVISKKILREFWLKYRDAEPSLKDWYKKVVHADWDHTDDVKRTFSSVDHLQVNKTTVSIFNIAGNNYRLIAVIHFDKKRLFVRGIFTHKEYDRGDWKDLI